VAVGVGLLLALTLPGLVLLLVGLGVLEVAATRLRRRSPLHRRHRHALSGSGLDVLAAALDPAREIERETRRATALLREDPGDGAPPRSRVDLERRVAVLVVPSPGTPASAPAHRPGR
jgi:hypothetical protein